MNRIALISAGYLGDTFWALQTLPLLHETFPNAEIFVIGRPFCNTLCKEKNVVVNSIPSDRHRDQWSFSSLMQDAKKVRKEIAPDLIFDLTGNRYSALFAWKTGAYTVGADIAGEAAALYQHCAPARFRKCQHLVQQPLTILRSFLGLPEQENTPSLLPPEPVFPKEEVYAKLDLQNDPLILLIPGAGWNAKMWQKEKFQALAKYCVKHGKTVLISGSKAEFELCKEIAQDLDRKQVRLMIDDLELVISLLPHLSCCIGNDSGISHLAAAAGVNTIQLFCPTNPVHSAALGERVSILRSSCPLKPENNEKFCTGTPIMTCSRKECMDHSVEQVIAEMERMSVL